MDVREFQKKLMDLMAFAIENNKYLTCRQVNDFFRNEKISEEQFTLIYQYLKSQGVAVEGMDSQKEQQRPIEEVTEEAQADPLTSDEEEYLREYLESLTFAMEKPGEKEALFARAQQGEREAVNRLAELYFPMAAKLCAEHHTTEFFLGDMIQEVNLSLLCALGQNQELSDQVIRGMILNGIQEALQEREQEKFQDDCLVAKVSSLEAAVKELTEDEEEERKFSIEELSVILDMDAEEIRDVLRLTGDN